LPKVVLLRNGCVCCSVRADLGRVLKEQLKRNADLATAAAAASGSLAGKLAWARGVLSGSAPAKGPGRPFDAIVVETTGVANPSPIIQLFFADPEVRTAGRELGRCQRGEDSSLSSLLSLRPPFCVSFISSERVL